MAHGNKEVEHQGEFTAEGYPVVRVTTEAYRGVWVLAFDCPWGCSTKRKIKRHFHGGQSTDQAPSYGYRESHCPYQKRQYELRPALSQGELGQVGREK
jgi:hypothetical protein